MTMRARPGVVVRQPSERAVAGDRGSVLQALRDLSPAPAPAPAREEPRRPAQRPSPAFLPARPDASRLDPTSTGVIDVREMAAARRRLGMAAPTAPGWSLVVPPVAPPAPQPVAPPVAAVASEPRSPSPLALQVRAFVLGALCAGALMGSLIVGAAAAAAGPVASSQAK